MRATGSGLGSRRMVDMLWSIGEDEGGGLGQPGLGGPDEVASVTTEGDGDHLDGGALLVPDVADGC